MNSLPPEAFLRISEYFDLDFEAGGAELDQQEAEVEACDNNKETVKRDLKMLEEVLSQYQPVFLDLTDPQKLEEQRRRNRKMRKTSMQKAFKGNEEDEDNSKLMGLLKESYKNEKKAQRVMDKHIDLIETMGKSDSIKDCEKH